MDYITMLDIIPYAFIGFLAIIVIVFGKNKYLYWGFFVFLVVFMGLRGFMTGGDTYYYLWGYNSVKNGDYFTVSMKFPEFLYLFLNYSVIHLNGNYRIFLILISFLTLFPVFYMSFLMGRHPNRIVGFYVLLYFYCMSFCFTRQFLAISFVYVAYLLLYKNNSSILFVLFIIIATLIHQSACLTLIVLFFKNKKYNPIVGMIFMIITYLLGRLATFGQLISILNLNYLFGSYQSQTINISLNGFLMVIFFSILLFDKSINSLFAFIIVIGVCFLNLFSFNSNIARLGWYFYIIEIFVFGEMSLRKNKLMQRTFVFLYCIAIYFNFLNVNTGNIMPYEYSIESEPSKTPSLIWNTNKRFTF